MTITSASVNFPFRVEGRGIKGAIFDSHAPCDIESVRAAINKPRHPPTTCELYEQAYKFQLMEPNASKPSRWGLWFQIAQTPMQPFVSERSNIPWLSIAAHALAEDLCQGLPVPQPDYYQGRWVHDYPWTIRNALGGRLQPALQGVAMPHFAAELKGGSKVEASARPQCAYVGACMVFAHRESLACLGLEKLYQHDRIIAITTAFNGTHLTLYAHFSESDRCVYHMHTIASYCCDTYGGFVMASSAPRNAQDFGVRQCDLIYELILK